MDQWLLLALVAGLLTTAGFVPQIAKAYRTKKMDDCSLLMPVVLASGMFLWFVYGLILNNIAIIVWNAISFSLNAVLIALKLKYRSC